MSNAYDLVFDFHNTCFLDLAGTWLPGRPDEDWLRLEPQPWDLRPSTTGPYSAPVSSVASGSVNRENGECGFGFHLCLRRLTMSDEVENMNKVSLPEGVTQKFTKTSSAGAGASLLEQLLTPTASSWEPDWK